MQDAGLPQVGCYSDLCNYGRELHAAGRGSYVASLALVGPDADSFFLVDATPDITRQIDLIEEAEFRRRAAERRPFDGIFLTHAHIGHYVGLAVLGNEGLGVRELPVYCTESMAEFLENNDPWGFMIRQERIIPTPVEPGRWTRASEWLDVMPFLVPHRDELSDTVGFVFQGPNASLLYLPDINSWERWASWEGPRRVLAEAVAEVDAALLDGSFWSADEVPGRAVEDIPHPLIPGTMDLLQEVVDDNISDVIFTHLNNSNPVLVRDGHERQLVEERGFKVAEEGMRIDL